MLRFVVVLTLALAGCAADPEPPRPVESEAAAAAPPASPDSLRDDLVQHGLLLPTGPRAELSAALGPPDSVRAAAVANRHDPRQTDSIATLFYPGITAEYYVVGAGGEMLASGRVTDNRHLRHPGLGVGAAARDIVSALGEPAERDAASLTYQCFSCEGAESPVVFHLAGDRVHAVEFRFYVD